MVTFCTLCHPFTCSFCTFQNTRRAGFLYRNFHSVQIRLRLENELEPDKLERASTHVHTIEYKGIVRVGERLRAVCHQYPWRPWDISQLSIASLEISNSWVVARQAWRLLAAPATLARESGKFAVLDQGEQGPQYLYWKFFTNSVTLCSAYLVWYS